MDALNCLLILSLTIEISYGTRPLSLIVNPSFEENLDGWFCYLCDLELQTGNASHGQNYGVVTNRQAARAGPKFRISGSLLQPGSYYDVSAFVKMRTPAYPFHEMKINAITTFNNGVTETEVVGIDRRLRPEDGWSEVGGEFLAQSNIEYVDLHFVVMFNYFVDFEIDQTTVIQYFDDAQWRTRAIARINQIRKNNIIIKASTPCWYVHGFHTVQVKQIKRSFPIGSAVDNTFMEDSEIGEKFRTYFYDLFNFAVHTHNFKWKAIESNEGQPKFVDVDELLNELQLHGIPMRGHNLLWANPDKVPDWLKSYKGENITAKAYRHVTDMLEQYKGRIPNYDVNNENNHYFWYEEKTGDQEFTQKLFHFVHELDPEAQLFLNDYNALSSNLYTYSLKRQAEGFKAAGVPIHVIGVQGHFMGWPNIHKVKRRLDKLHEAGVPVWITELDLELMDIQLRKYAFQNLLTLFYSHPAVEGIMLWGFWNNTAKLMYGGSLVDGDDFVENAAGATVRQTLQVNWRTHRWFIIPEGTNTSTHTVHAYHGTYEIVMRHMGRVIVNKTVELVKGQDLVIDISP